LGKLVVGVQQARKLQDSAFVLRVILVWPLCQTEFGGEDDCHGLRVDVFVDALVERIRLRQLQLVLQHIVFLVLQILQDFYGEVGSQRFLESSHLTLCILLQLERLEFVFMLVLLLPLQNVGYLLFQLEVGNALEKRFLNSLASQLEQDGLVRFKRDIDDFVVPQLLVNEVRKQNG